MSKKPPKVEVPESLREIYAQLDGKPAPVAAATPAPAVDGSLKDIYASLGMAGKFEEPAAAAPPAPPPLPVVFESLKGIYSELGIDGKSVEKPAEPPAPAAPAPRKEEIEDEQLRRMLGEATKNSFDVMGSGSHPDIVDAVPHRTHLVSGPGSVQFEDERPRRGAFRDDWDVEIERNEKAQIGPRGEILDDFDATFQVRQAEQAEQQAAAPSVSTAPPSASGAILGGQITLTMPLVNPVRQETEVAAWSADSDTETTPVTVIFGPIGILYSGIAGALAVRPYGVVSFGTRGFLLRAEVDIGQGTMLTVAGSQVRLSVGLGVPPVKNFLGVTSPPVTMTGMMSFLTTQKQNQVTRTLYIDQLAGGGFSGPMPVPAFAKNLWVGWFGTGQGLIVTLYASDNSVLYGFEVPAPVIDTTVIQVPIPLSGDVAAVAVNNTGVGPENIKLIFGLDF